MIRVDATPLSAVVVCSDCPWWRGFGFDRADGWRVGRNHELNFHPGRIQAAATIRKSEGRK